MKLTRLFCTVLCVAFLLCSFTVLAEGERYEELFTYSTLDYAYTDDEGHSFFIIGDNRGHNGVIMDDGTVLAWLECYRIHYLLGSDGYFEVTYDNGSLNNLALLSSAGELITEAAYADFEVLGTDWVAAICLKVKAVRSNDPYDYSDWFSSAKYTITNVDIYHFDADNNQYAFAGSFTRQQYRKANPAGKDHIVVEDRDGKVQLYDGALTPIDSAYTSIYDSELYITKIGFEKCVVSRITGEKIASGVNILNTISNTNDRYMALKENARWDDLNYAVMDGKGNFLTDFVYDSYAQSAKGYMVVSNGEKKGLLRSSDGELVISCEYDDILEDERYNGYVHNGYVAVVKNDKIGYVDLEGNETLPATYAKNEFTVLGCTMFSVDPLDGTYILISADGRITRGISEISELYRSDDGYFLLVKDQDGKSGVIDWHGETVIPFFYNYIKVFGDGYTIIDSTAYRLVK